MLTTDKMLTLKLCHAIIFHASLRTSARGYLHLLLMPPLSEVEQVCIVRP